MTNLSISSTITSIVPSAADVGEVSKKSSGLHPAVFTNIENFDSRGKLEQRSWRMTSNKDCRVFTSMLFSPNLCIGTDSSSVCMQVRWCGEKREAICWKSIG